MHFPGIFDVWLLAIDSIALVFVFLFNSMYRRHHKPVWLVLTTVSACNLVVFVLLTLYLWSFMGYG